MTLYSLTQSKWRLAVGVRRGALLGLLLLAGCAPQYGDDFHNERTQGDELRPLPREQQVTRPLPPRLPSAEIEILLAPQPLSEVREEDDFYEEESAFTGADFPDAGEESDPYSIHPHEEVPPPPPPLPLPEAVQGVQARFIQSLQRLTEERQEAQQRLNALYAQELADLEALFQARGSLQGVVALKSERERFEREQRVDARDQVAQPEELARLQELYIASEHDGVFQENARMTISLIDRYTQGLERMVSELVQKGNIDDAQAVQQEIDRVNLFDERADAVQVMDETLTPRIQETVAPTDPPTSAAHWGQGVYRLGEESAGDFSELLVRHTRHSRAGAHRARATLMLREDAQLTRNDRTQRERVRMGEIAYYPRVVLRPSPRESFVGCTLVFQYYAHALEEGTRFVLMRTEHIPLPDLRNGQEAVVDGAGVRYYISEYRYLSRRGHDHLRGHDHAGLIFSVYDANGKLLVQGTDSLPLADQASIEIPSSLNDERGNIYHHRRN